MKVLLVNKFHYIKGGSETYYFGLGQLLERNGIDVIYFSMKDGKNVPCAQEKYFVDHVDFNAPMGFWKTIKTSLKMLYSFEAKRKFEQLILDEKPDIIHLNIFQSQLTGSIVDVAKKHHIPIVYTAHDLKSVCPNYQMLNHGVICEKCLSGHYVDCFKTACMKDSRIKSLLATFESYVYKWKKIYQKIDLVITPSAFYKNKLECAGIFHCPIVHLPNFLPEDTNYQVGSENGNYFLYFGRLSREKGIFTLLKAFTQANVNKPLYIVGTGPEQKSIGGWIRQNHLESRVKMLGFQSGKELKEIIANAVCVCLLSEWYENGPYSIMEAQALGRPVIVSNVGGLPELIEDGVTGYISTPKDVEDLALKLEICDAKLDWNRESIVNKAMEYYASESYFYYLQRIYSSCLKM